MPIVADWMVVCLLLHRGFSGLLEPISCHYLAQMIQQKHDLEKFVLIILCYYFLQRLSSVRLP